MSINTLTPTTAPEGTVVEKIGSIGAFINNEDVKIPLNTFVKPTGENAVTPMLNSLESIEQNTSPKENNTYFIGAMLQMPDSQTPINFFWLRNTSNSKSIKIVGIDIVSSFSAAQTLFRIAYNLRKATDVTSTTGAVTLLPCGSNTWNESSVSDIKYTTTNTGGTLTGANFVSNQNILSFGAASIVSTTVIQKDLTKNPIILGFNEALVLQNVTTMNGAHVHINLTWVEE